MHILVWVIRTIVAYGVFITAAEATTIMAFSVEDMARRADKIFVGTCVKAERSVTDQGTPVVEVTFVVREALKGDLGETVTFRQVDPISYAQPSASVSLMWPAAALANVPSYPPGEEMLIFLAKEGSTGLTAPVGVSQGAMPVRLTPAGKKVITNHALRRTERTDILLPEPGKAASYEQFVAALRRMTQPGQ